MSDVMAKKCSQFMGEMKRTIAKEKRELGEKMTKKREDEFRSISSNMQAPIDKWNNGIYFYSLFFGIEMESDGKIR